MRAKLATALFVAMAFQVMTEPARACSCMSSGPACQAYWKTDAVFDATVRSIRPLDSSQPLPQLGLNFVERIVQVDVRQRWKGVETGLLEITTGPEGGGCGFPFREGGRYLVFARRGADGRLQASLCSATQLFNGSGDAADFVESLASPSPGGRVFGTVTTGQRVFDPAQPSSKRSPTETLVRLFGGGQERTTRSTGGEYEFSGLIEGPYRIELQIPDGYTTYDSSRLVQIPDRRACAEEAYSLSPAGRITGRLVGKENRGLSRVQVEVTDPDARAHPLYGLASEGSPTDADGYFEVRSLPPGRYIVGVNLKDLPNQYNPYARTVFPGGDADPQIITLSLGQIFDLGTWQMPRPLAVVKVAGLITWKDGTPAGEVYVSALDRTGNPVERARGAGGATSALDGRFVLDLREGRVYTFMARDKQPALLPVVGPRIETGPTPPAPLVLVIQRDPPRE
jgi:hypothetical protein